MAKSATGFNDAVLLAVFFAVFGSVTPLGSATVAVSMTLPVDVADGVYVPVIPNDSVSPEANEMPLKIPVDESNELPAGSVKCESVNCVINESVSVKLVTVLGPLFATCSV